MNQIDLCGNCKNFIDSVMRIFKNESSYKSTIQDFLFVRDRIITSQTDPHRAFCQICWIKIQTMDNIPKNEVQA